MASDVNCGPCLFHTNFKIAMIWCEDCLEGLCRDCEKNHTALKICRHHNLISIREYLKMLDAPVDQRCVTHGHRYSRFCYSHDTAFCDACEYRHKFCSRITDLDTAQKNVKGSLALIDLRKTIREALQNLENMIEDQEDALIAFENKEKTIRNEIDETRQKLNKRLDLLEEDLIADLSEKSNKCKSAYKKKLHNLNTANNRIKQLQHTFEKVQMLESNAQVFLGIREINKNIVEEIKSVKRSVGTTNYQIALSLDSTIKSFAEKIYLFGKVWVTENNAGLKFKDTNIDQAQIQACLPIHNAFNISLSLKQTFEIKKSGEKGCKVGSCLIMPNSNILIADTLGADQLMEYNSQGKHIRDIKIRSTPEYISLMDSDGIVISYGTNIETLNATFRQVNLFTVNEHCVGISYHNWKLYLVVRENGIMVFNLTGQLLNRFNISTFNVWHIATSADRIYFTDDGKNTTNCYDMSGRKIWEKRIHTVRLPSGIAVGENEDVFVAGSTSNNITIIRNNGKDSKTLLTAANELYSPQAIHYSKQHKTLLVYNATSGNATLYKVA